MYLYRVVQNKSRTIDLSGTGAFQLGGRWNNKGTYMLYSSENSSLALLENLVHFDKLAFPPNLYIIQLEVDDLAPIYTLPDADYPAKWLEPDLLENKALGDKWMDEKKFLGIKVKSAVNLFEYNYLLNPRFPGFHDLVKIIAATEIDVDGRFML